MAHKVIEREFIEREILVETVLYDFKRLQKWFQLTGELVYMKCYPNTEEVIMMTRPACYVDTWAPEWRKNMFDKYTVRDEDLEYSVIKYIHEEELLNEITNETLLFWFGITCENLKLHLNLEMFLVCLKLYRRHGFTPKASILEMYLAEPQQPLPTLVTSKELVAA